MSRGCPSRESSAAAANRCTTMLWQTVRMPDDQPAVFPRRDPERIDLAALSTDIECVMWPREVLGLSPLTERSHRLCCKRSRDPNSYFCEI
jgi:hypothetical protein